MLRKVILLILISNTVISCAPSMPFSDHSSTNSAHERSEKKFHKQAKNIREGMGRSLQKQNKSFTPSSYDTPNW